MNFKEILNYIPISIYGLEYNPALGPQTGKVIFCNKTISEILGYTETEIVEMGFDFFRTVIHPDDLYKTSQTISTILNTEVNAHTDIFRVKTKNSTSYTKFKSYCKLIVPIKKKEPLQFLVTCLLETEKEASYCTPNIFLSKESLTRFYN